MIKCVTSGEPFPAIYWVFNNTLLVNGSRSGRVAYTSISSTQYELSAVLSITNVDPKADKGQYSCVSTNKRGTRRASSTMDVWSELSFYVYNNYSISNNLLLALT